MDQFHGIIPPICTPQTPAGDIDVPSLHKLIDFQIENGVHGIFVLGSTGEFALLTGEQRNLVVRGTIAAVDGRVPVLVGILDTSTRRCLEHARVAQAAGADGLVLAATYYYRVGQAEIMHHFRAVQAGVDLPIMAYDIPGTVGVKLDVATIVQLQREGVIAGMKDSSGVVDAFRHVLIQTRGTDFCAFTGSELIVDSCLRMGAAGSVPGLCNVFPAEYVQIYALSQAGDWDGAAQIQERLLACFYELINQGDPGFGMTSSALGGFKSALKLRGIIAHTQVAAPIQSFGPVQEERVAEVMRRHGFL